MTPLDQLTKLREEIERLDAAATQGPWAITHREPAYSSAAPRNVIGPEGSTFKRGKMNTCICCPHMDEDADLIVFLRNNIKALLTIAEALAAEVERLTSRLAAAEKQRDEAVRSLTFIHEHSGQRVASIHAEKALQRIAAMAGLGENVSSAMQGTSPASSTEGIPN